MNSRLDNLRMILLAPVWLIRFVVAMILLVVTMMVGLIPWVFLIAVPCLACWILSPFIGLVSPRHGHWLANEPMEFACRLMEFWMDGVVDTIVAPLMGD